MNRKKLKDNIKSNQHLALGVTIFLAGSALIGVYYVLFHSSKLSDVFSFLTDMLMPIVYGFVLSYVLIPVLNFVEGKVVIPFLTKRKVDVDAKQNKIRATSVAITAIVSAFVIYSFIHMIIAQIVPSIEEIINNFDVYTDNIIAYVNDILEDNAILRFYFNNIITTYSSELDAWLNTLMPQISSFIMNISKSVISVLGVLWDFILGFILSIYILNSKDIFACQGKKIIYSLFSNEKANELLLDVRFVHKTFTGFITGKVIDSIIIGLICFVGTTILRTPYAALVSLIIGATNVIPFFGPFLGAIPCAILIFVVAPLQPLNVVYFAIFILLLQQFDGNILGPKILGDSTGLSSFWVIFSITIFGGLLGVAGMVIGVPTFAVIFTAIRRSVNARLSAKGLPTNRKKYDNLERVNDENQIVERDDSFDFYKRN